MRGEVEDQNCPCGPECVLQKALTMVGGKWKLPVLCTLMVDGPCRYNVLLKKTRGISNTMLSQTLKELESDGLVNRCEYLQVPVRVEYSLTDKAKRLQPILTDIVEWMHT